MSYKSIQTKTAFTLIEVLVGTAVFLIVALASYQAYTSLFVLISLNQYKILALDLANEQFEIARNLTYSDVGEVAGVPNGKIPHVQNLTRGGVDFVVTSTVRNIDLPFDGTIGGTPNDLSPADNKLIEVEVACPNCKSFTPIILTTTIAPKNVESASTNGALFIKVFDANGQPVQNANVHIVNSSRTPVITIDDVTDINGMLQVVDAPPGNNVYAITVSKAGYSTSQTLVPGAVGNPSPTKPHATVVLQQVTQDSFSIDRLSTFTFLSVTATCSAVAGVRFSLVGSKTIGVGIPKYTQNLVTNSSGIYSNSSMEWDTYTAANLDSAYDIIGTNPLNAIPLNPNSTQNVQLIVQSKNPRSLLVTVKDSSTGLPVTGATVQLTNTSGYSSTKVTDRGYINQTDWTGGTGQDLFTDITKYFANDSGINTNSPAGELKLEKAFGTYVPNGNLESSTIDTGSSSDFHDLMWTPTDEPVEAGAGSVRLQFATNKELTATTTWDFKGPDGTSGSYYTVSNSTINPVHNSDRYARYKVYLATANATSTPNISDVSFTYTSLCTPPGQVVFSGLGASGYSLSVSKSGYTTAVDDAIDMSSANWIEKSVTLSQ